MFKMNYKFSFHFLTPEHSDNQQLQERHRLLLETDVIQPNWKFLVQSYFFRPT